MTHYLEPNGGTSYVRTAFLPAHTLLKRPFAAWLSKTPRLPMREQRDRPSYLEERNSRSSCDTYYLSASERNEHNARRPCRLCIHERNFDCGVRPSVANPRGRACPPCAALRTGVPCYPALPRVAHALAYSESQKRESATMLIMGNNGRN